ncbi:MAG: tRNA 2-thiouridine(34) synthase MnmA, partial [Desulfobacteraceae bacterium]|nr:tRNA 2-thiouridine(34) synthase MnmA [Desulfobacteraceae bacterium]
MTSKNVLVAISGGVDSAIAALRSLEEGLHTEGLYLKLTNEAPGLDAATRIAQKLGIKLHVIDAVDQFNAEVIEYFRASYLAGLTPNPCAVCNP